MKVAVLINLGDYNNIRVESGEYDSIEECKEEVNLALATIHELRVDAFRRRLFEPE